MFVQNQDIALVQTQYIILVEKQGIVSVHKKKLYLEDFVNIWGTWQSSGLEEPAVRAGGTYCRRLGTSRGHSQPLPFKKLSKNPYRQAWLGNKKRH